MSAEWIKATKVGDKVVCVDDDYSAYGAASLFAMLESGQKMPALGAALTIREIVICKAYGTPYFRFDEIHNSPWFFNENGVSEIAFDAAAFLPVQPRKTDISVLTALLNTKPADQPIREDA
jgi:hypothetical protein